MKNFPSDMIKLLLNLVLETGNNCQNMLKFYHFFEKEINSLKYLKINRKIDTTLFNKIKQSKEQFLQSWDKYGKMGNIIGQMLAWFIIFKPLNSVKRRDIQIKTLMSLFKRPINNKKNISKKSINDFSKKMIKTRQLKKWLNYIP